MQNPFYYEHILQIPNFVTVISYIYSFHVIRQRDMNEISNYLSFFSPYFPLDALVPQKLYYLDSPHLTFGALVESP